MQGSVQEQPGPATRRGSRFRGLPRYSAPGTGLGIIGPAFLGIVAGRGDRFPLARHFRGLGANARGAAQGPTAAGGLEHERGDVAACQRDLQGIVSRTNLSNLITNHNLYPDKRKRLPMDDVVDDMRKDIVISR